MQYLVLTFLGSLIVAALLWVWLKTAALKYLFLQKIISKKIIDGAFFSTLAMRQLARYILKQPRQNRRFLLRAVSENNFAAVGRRIDNPLLKAKLRLMRSGRVSRVSQPDALYLLMQAGLCLKKNQYERAAAVLQKIDIPKKDRALKALSQLLVAKIALFESDLLAASEEAAAALKVFQKENMLYEEAQAYFVLGTIYRVSGVFDTADFMLRASLKLLRFLSSSKAEIEVLGTFGLLMAVQKRFDEAAAFLSEAETLARRTGDAEMLGFIISQQAMLELLQGRLKAAEKLARKALKENQASSCAALASDILSRAAYAAGNWSQAAKFAAAAADKYLAEHNYAAGFESRYLTAEAYAALGKTDEAEIVLRELIDKEQYHKSCFHVANAYTLLGLILLQKNDVSRAKAIFNQALKQEFCNDRRAGIAVDYANLAAVERKCGNWEEARKNLETALAYAEGVDEDLYRAVKAALGQPD